MATAQNKASKELKPATSKAARLRAMITSQDLEFIMEAHNGLSAKIVEEAGFKGANIGAVYAPGQWLDVDDAADFTKAGKFL
ncbi:MAG: hypothetical protein V3R37_02540 [Rhodospirillales bacterium]